MTTQQSSQESASSSLSDKTNAEKRRKWSCEQCRKDKQKCEPVGRNWALLQKCQRCERLGHPCGQPINVTAQRQRKRKEIKLSSARASPEAMALRDLANLAQSQPELTMSSSFGISAHSARPQPIVVDVGSNSKTPGTAKTNEVKARAILCYLEDTLVTKYQLEEYSKIINEAERIGGDPGVIASCRLALDEAKQALYMIFVAARLRFEECRKEKDLQFRRELTERFRSVSQAFQRDGMSDKISPYGDEKEDMHDIEKHYQQDRRSWENDPTQASMAFHIREGALTKSDVDKDIDKDLAPLVEAATRLSRIFNIIARNASTEACGLLFPQPPSQASTSTQLQSSFRFPAIFLALRYTSSDFIARFVTKRGKYLTEQGLFGLTALQVATYTQQIHKLEKTFENDAGLPVAWCYNDVFSLTPILIAGFRNDIAAFKILHQHHANTDACDYLGRSVRVLCATQDSKEVMTYILEQNIWMFSTWSDILAAILANRSKMAKRLAKYYTRDDQIRADARELILFAQEAAVNQSLYNPGERAWEEVVQILADGAQHRMNPLVQNPIVQNSYDVTAATFEVEFMSWEEATDYTGPR